MLQYLSALFSIVIIKLFPLFLVILISAILNSIFSAFYVMVYRVNKVPNKLDFVVVCTTLVYSSLFISVLLFCSVGFWLVQYSRWFLCPARLKSGSGLFVFFHWCWSLWVGMSLGVGCEVVICFSPSRDYFIGLSWY